MRHVSPPRLLPSPSVLQEDERRGRDTGAATYLDRLRATRGAFRMSAENLAVRRALAPHRGQVVLDAGSGVGRHALSIAGRVRRVVCVDFSAGSLAALAIAASTARLRNVETVVADLARLPDGLGPFHSAMSCEVFQHIPTHEARVAALRSIRSRLLPGARCVLTVLAWNWRIPGDKEGRWANAAYRICFTPDELTGLFRAAGFSKVSVRGMLILPGRLTRRLPASFAALDAGLSRLPGTERIGRFLIGTGRA